MYVRLSGCNMYKLYFENNFMCALCLRGMRQNKFISIKRIFCFVFDCHHETWQNYSIEENFLANHFHGQQQNVIETIIYHSRCIKMSNSENVCRKWILLSSLFSMNIKVRDTRHAINDASSMGSRVEGEDEAFISSCQTHSIFSYVLRTL